MRYNELNKYKVRCKIPADEGDIINRSSETGYDLLSDYEEELKSFFESDKDVDIETVKNHLKTKYSYIESVEPII